MAIVCGGGRAVRHIVQTGKGGRQIAEAVGERAEYGRNLLAYLSERLTREFGKGFTERNLRAMRQFYETFPIRHALRAELTWTHSRCPSMLCYFTETPLVFLGTSDTIRLIGK